MNDRTAIATTTAGVPALAMSEQELMSVLQNSLYPGAKVESIKLVLGYCKASGLDPMQKPVHIVPMDVKVADPDGRITYVKRDVVMPGIGLYRTQASRTGEYAGVSEPTYGPPKKIKTKVKQWNNAHQGDKTFQMVDGEEIEFPEWCRITVRRLLGERTVEFTALEYWLENYATAGKDTTSPNAMWKRRPFAQLAKCAEAQALRKAFPELGAAPTADEMEGKEFAADSVVIEQPLVAQPRSKSKAVAQEHGDTGLQQEDSLPASAAPQSSAAQDPETVTSGSGLHPASTPAADDGPSRPMIAGQLRIVRAKLVNAGMTDVDLVAKFGKIEGLRFDDFAAIQTWLQEKAA